MTPTIAPPERAFEKALKEINRRLRALERGQREMVTPPSGGGGVIGAVVTIGPVTLYAEYASDGTTVLLWAKNTLTGTTPTLIATLA